MTTAILWPTFALVFLIYAVWVQIPVRRVAHAKTTPPGRADFATGEAERRYFAPVDAPARNLANLFEMPVLFFGLVPLLLVTRHAGTIEVALAWLFVALRAAHSVVHTGRNVIRTRFYVYGASCTVLAVMWVGFAVDVALGR